VLHFDVRAVSLALVGRRAQFELGIEWTLIVEIFFYVVLFLLAVLRCARFLEAFALAWLAAIGVAVLVEPAMMAQTLLPTVLQVFFLPGNAAFAGGLLIPAILKRGGFPPALAAIAFAFGAVSMSVDLAYGRLLGAVAAVIIVGAAFGQGPSTRAPSLVERAFGHLGDWSYALYLCHVPMIWLVYAHLPAPTVVQWLVAVGSAILISIPVGKLDVALYRRLRSITNRSTEAVRARLVWAYMIAYAVVAVLFLFKQG
jgi:peptidoglycan/LPS O-acetylase OafA/YrhL